MEPERAPIVTVVEVFILCIKTSLFLILLLGNLASLSKHEFPIFY